MIYFVVYLGVLYYIFSSNYCSVEDKICMGTECEENKASTSNQEDDQVSGKGTVLSTTSDTN